MQSHLPRQVERLQYFFSPVGIHVSNLGSNKHKRRNGNGTTHTNGTGVSFSAVNGVKRTHTSSMSSDFSSNFPIPVQLSSAAAGAADTASAARSELSTHNDSMMTAPIRTTDLMAWTGSGSGTLASAAALRGDPKAGDVTVTPMSTSSMSLRSVGSAMSMDSVSTPVAGSSSMTGSTPAASSPSKRSLRHRRNRRLYSGIETTESIDSLIDTMISYGFETSSDIAAMQPWQLRVLKKEVSCIEQIYVRAFQMWGNQEVYNEMFNKVYRQFVNFGVWLELNEVCLIMKCFDARMYGYRCFICGENEGLNELDALRLHLWKSHRNSFQIQYAMEESKTTYWAKHLPETVDVQTLHAIQAAMSSSHCSHTHQSSHRSVSIGKPHNTTKESTKPAKPEVIDLIDSSDEDDTAHFTGIKTPKKKAETGRSVESKRKQSKHKQQRIPNRETSVDEMILRSAQIHDRQQRTEMSVDKSISPPRSHLLDSLNVTAPSGHDSTDPTQSTSIVMDNGYSMFDDDDFPLFDPIAGVSDFNRSVSGVFDDRSTNAFAMFEQCVLNPTNDLSSDPLLSQPSNMTYGHSDPFKEWSDESLFSTSF